MEVMLKKGTIVRGSWSKLEYRVEHTGTCKYGGWVTGRCPDNPSQTGSFSYLGERVGNEILITDPRRPKDRLIIVKEINPKIGQLVFGFVTKIKEGGEET
tara:strand:+ start:241 stop:540 length:300 start_codon:yes stop_codon:yes gene_type:complete